jgi:hypothetical protein
VQQTRPAGAVDRERGRPPARLDCDGQTGFAERARDKRDSIGGGQRLDAQARPLVERDLILRYGVTVA